MKTFLYTIGYCLILLIADTNNFFLKFILYIPADHNLLLFRVVLWGLIAINASREYYEFMSHNVVQKLGPNIWIAMMCLMLEVSIIVKHGITLFTEPFPWYVKLMWQIIGSVFLALLFYSYQNSKKIIKQEPFNRFDP